MPTPCFKAFSALSALRSQQSLDQRTITEQRQTPVWADAHTGASLCFGEVQVYGLHQLPPGLVADALEEEPFHPYTIEGQVDLSRSARCRCFASLASSPAGTFICTGRMPSRIVSASLFRALGLIFGLISAVQSMNPE